MNPILKKAMSKLGAKGKAAMQKLMDESAELFGPKGANKVQMQADVADKVVPKGAKPKINAADLDKARAAQSAPTGRKFYRDPKTGRVSQLNPAAEGMVDIENAVKMTPEVAPKGVGLKDAAKTVAKGAGAALGAGAGIGAATAVAEEEVGDLGAAVDKARGAAVDFLIDEDDTRGQILKGLYEQTEDPIAKQAFGIALNAYAMGNLAPINPMKVAAEVGETLGFLKGEDDVEEVKEPAEEAEEPTAEAEGTADQEEDPKDIKASQKEKVTEDLEETDEEYNAPADNFADRYSFMVQSGKTREEALESLLADDMPEEEAVAEEEVTEEPEANYNAYQASMPNKLRQSMGMAEGGFMQKKPMMAKGGMIKKDGKDC